MRLMVKNPDWMTKTIQVKDRTKKVLKNGNIVPTWLAMTRNAAK